MAGEVTALAWREFDQVVANAAMGNPWHLDVSGRRRYIPDLRLLESLLAVPLRLGLKTQSGVPAKAVDVWLAHELRRSGFDEDEVWPRASVPRVLPREVAMLRNAPGMTRLGKELFERIESGRLGGGAVGADARILGKAYEKQVDVVIAQWSTGPELLISTKRMDSSFGKNALNRIEESYGDAKNLRGRHPLAATGFMFVMRSTAFEREKESALRLMDLLEKLEQEPDAYDATGIVIVEWQDPASGAPIGPDVPEGAPIAVEVGVREDLIPPRLRPDRFLSTIVSAVLDRSPVGLHTDARVRRATST